MQQRGIIRRNLIERLEELPEAHGEAVAQTYIASGDPDDEPGNLTFSDFIAETRRRANALCALGGAGQVIAFASPLSETSYPMMVATMAAATYAPINYFLEVEPLVRIVRASGAKILLFHRRFDDGGDIIGKLARVCESLPHVRLMSFGAGERVDGARDLDSVAAAESPSTWDPSTLESAANRVVALFHTGGTTGHPKLVPHTEAMYDAMIDACGAGEGTVPGESVISGLPLFHTSGALQAGLVPLLNGARVLIPSSQGFRDPRVIANYWRLVRRFGITIGAGVPTVLAAVSTIAPDGPVPSIKRFLVGGAPIAKATIAKINQMTAGAEVIEGWGMTETCGFSVMNPHGRPKVGSVGLPFPGVDLEVREFCGAESTGSRCDANVIGEVVVRGSIVIDRYLDDRPNAFTPDGWLRTGDLGRCDEEGYLWITGRLKDIILRGGHNIDPAIIEEPAYQHPAVQLAAAVGKPDRYAGELPILFVQLKSGAQATEQDLEAFLRERIPERAAVPKSITIVSEIPVSGVGKISKLHLRRRAIRDVFQEEIDRLALDRLQIRAATVEDRLAGEVVVLSTSGAIPNSQELREVSAALGGFSIPYRWAESGERR
ncbi:MAG TPA: AMP-binding protein [Roseiarcus sp.]|nr:AMP-binding protein [Roseiarcus sp.]